MEAEFAALVDANTIGADKYFHCNTNCQASARGCGGTQAAEFIGETREHEYISEIQRPACDADRAANDFGRCHPPPCKRKCAPYRPQGQPWRN